MRWTKTAGSASDKFQETSVFNETLRIERIARTQGGRYYCKAENGVGVPAIKSIRVDVQCELWSLEVLDPDGTGPSRAPDPSGMRKGDRMEQWQGSEGLERPLWKWSAVCCPSALYLPKPFLHFHVLSWTLM